MKLNATSRKILKWVGNIITVICVLLLIWGIISFVDLDMHNGFGGTGPSDWNMFKILVDWSNAQ